MLQSTGYREVNMTTDNAQAGVDVDASSERVRREEHGLCVKVRACVCMWVCVCAEDDNEGCVS